MDNSKEIEKFVIYILEKNALEDNKISRRVLCDFYTKFIAHKSTLIPKNPIPFKDFLKEMWKTWYIMDVVDGADVHFNPKWIDYFQMKRNLSCSICRIKYTDEISFQVHLIEKEHVIREKYLKGGKQFIKNPNLLIEVINDNNNIVRNKIIANVNTRICLPLIISNKSDTVYTMINIIKVNDIKEITLDTEMSLIEKEKPVYIKVNGYFEHSCTFKYPLVICIKNSTTSEDILYEIDFEITSDYTKTLLSNVTKISQPKVHINTRSKKYKIRPEQKFMNNDFEIILGKYEIPKRLKNQLSRFYRSCLLSNVQRDNKKFAEQLNITSKLTPLNYCKILDKLLYIEEYQMTMDIKQYDTKSKLKPLVNGTFELEVPGLEEARPSIMLGDSVNIYHPSKSDKKIYVGSVDKVLQNSVWLIFHQKFRRVHFNNIEFFVRFTFNRRPFRVAHQALEICNDDKIATYFFPNKIHQEIQEINMRLNYFNENLNEEQKLAVENILHEKNYPYLLFGPPGTGKTNTLVEAILQVWKLDKKILICAPSNAAVDEIACRLSLTEQIKSQLFRMYGSKVGPKTKSKYSFDGNSNVLQNGNTFVPKYEDLLEYRIILTTLVTSANLVNASVRSFDFDYVFIDESGYATECQTLIPIAGILSRRKYPGRLTGQVVLSGDPEQLGPLIQSPIAKNYGLDRSMMERLMNSLNIYSKPNPKVFMKLVKNYRSNKHILHVPNKLFYKNELEAVESENSESCLLYKWKYLPKENFPVLFHHIDGEIKQDHDSPSFYNVQEIEEVINYLRKLIGYKLENGFVINEEHIGIITPYQKQVEKLKKACIRNKWSSIEIKSVEQFQGKEKLIIIVSTVRSKCDKHFEKINAKCSIGFLDSKKRFNVTLTRAKALCVVIGNAPTLYSNNNWREYINYCRKNDSLLPKNYFNFIFEKLD